MKYLFIILLLNLLLGNNCDDLDNRTVDLINKEKVRKGYIQSDEYRKSLNKFNDLLNDIDSGTCDMIHLDSLKVSLMYSYADYRPKNQGDMKTYVDLYKKSKNIFKSTTTKIQEKIKKGLILSDNVSDYQKITKRWKKYINEIDQFINSDNKFSLNNNFKNLKLFIESDGKISKDMAQILHQKGEKISFFVKPSPFFMKKSSEMNDIDKLIKNRYKFLMETPIELSLTAYDGEKEGYYCEVRYIPFLRKKTRKYEDYYSITFSDNSRYRFQFDRKLTESVIVNINNHNWKESDKIPDQWTKIHLPKNIDWYYYNQIENNNLYEYSWEDNRLKDNTKGDSDFMIIEKDNEYVLYQHNLISDRRYKLKMRLDEKKSIIPNEIYGPLILFLLFSIKSIF